MRTVADLMTLDPATILQEATLRDVVEKMRAEACRQIPVLDRSGRLMGIITDRDVRLAVKSPLILHEPWEDEEMLDLTLAESIMTRDPITIRPEAAASEAAEMLSAYKFGALPVISELEELIGIISVSDFLDWFVREAEGVSTVEIARADS